MRVPKLCVVWHPAFMILILLQAYGSAWTSRPFLLTKLCTQASEESQVLAYLQLPLLQMLPATSVPSQICNKITASTRQYQQCSSDLPFGLISE